MTATALAWPENTDTGAIGLTVGAFAGLIVTGALLGALVPAHVVTVSVTVSAAPTNGAVYTGLEMLLGVIVPDTAVHRNVKTGSGAVTPPFSVIDPPWATV